MPVSLTRRGFLTASGAAVLAGVAACSTDGGSPGPSGNGSAAPAATLPSYIPYAGVSPDVEGTADGVMPVFYQFPRDPSPAVSITPGAGAEPIEFLTNLFTPAPPTAGSNSYWQLLNETIGTDVEVTMTPAGDYLAKLSTIVAGGQLPDAMLISARLANRSEVLTRLCADLTEHVAGDAVADFPFLANLPTDAWERTRFGDGIFGVPIPRSVMGTIMFTREDLITERGLNAAPASYDEFVELAEGLTDAAANRWAFGNPKGIITFIGNMLGVPNVWREEGGGLRHEIEFEERKEAVARTAELVQAGLFHPDAVGGSLQLRDLFGAGTISITSDGYAAWDILASTYGVPIGALPAFGADGGPGTHRAGGAAFAITALKDADPERVRQVLAVLDWMSAPMGTQEYMLRKFGVEGEHFEWEDDAPVRTPLGETEVKVPLEYIAEAPPVLGPGPRERLDAQRAYQETVAPTILRDPTNALASDAAVNLEGELSRIIETAELDIVSGRKTIESWDDAVEQWRTAGGDQIRAEYEAQLG